ncbi:uncharacterized protein LOC134535481 isoform X2 [Bacillus rossius redtenbacheri]|uniref:uncharacterized protein LOC134535481 isoform X2 n=1 Tax=Bacillus rossius redtenbacheri TaxID=93214 RepID=UPI002FDDA824
METPWQHFGIYLGLTFLDCCVAYPIDFSSSGQDAGWSTVLLAAVFSVCSVLLLGCLCCRADKGFQEFSDSTSSHSVSAAAVAGSSAELTVFPPPAVRFEPLPAVPGRRPPALSAALRPGPDLTARDWFQAPHANFPRHQLKYVRELGRGWFGRVVAGEAQGLAGGEPTCSVVVKILHEDATATDQMLFLHEARPYRDLRHPNVLRLAGRCLETEPFLLVLEACPGGDLKSFLTTNAATADALNQQGVTLQMACHIAAGLHHMLDQGFVHTDLAARNCLVASDLTVKIGDYGIGIETYKEDYYCAGDVALPIRWCAPETLHCTDTTIETKEVTASANVWSLGVVLWEICQFGRLPYAELTDEEVIVQVLGELSRRLPLPSLPSPHRHNLYQLMKQCWSPEPQRPVLGQVLRMLNHLYASRERHKRDGDNSSLGTDEDFERRWELFKPNTIPKTDNHVTPQASVSAVQSPVRDSEMSAGHRELVLGKFRSADALLPDFGDRASVGNSSRRDSENLGSATPQTTSPQPSLSSSTGGEFFLPNIHNCHKSPSLQNLRGSIDDLSEGLSDARKLGETDSLAEEIDGQNLEITEESTEIETASEQEFDSWLKGVSTTNEEDAKFVRKVSEAIRDLDDALALEKTSSSSSDSSSKCASNHSTPVKQAVAADQNMVLDFRLGGERLEGAVQPDSLQEDSLSDRQRRASRGTDSGTDTEDETWRRRVEQGEFTKKVKEKSKSVADLMVLTHIECSDGSDSDTPSLARSFERGSYRRSSLRRQRSVPTRTLKAFPGAMYGSDGDLHGAVLCQEFRNALDKMRAARGTSCSEETLLYSSPGEQSPARRTDLIGNGNSKNASNHKDGNFLSFDASDKVSQSANVVNAESQTGVVPSSEGNVLDLKPVSEVLDSDNVVPVCSSGLDSDFSKSVCTNKTYIVHEIRPDCEVASQVASNVEDKIRKNGASLPVNEFHKVNNSESDTAVDVILNNGLLNGSKVKLSDGHVLSSSQFATSTPMPKPNKTNEFTINMDPVVLPFPEEDFPALEESVLSDKNNISGIESAGTSMCDFATNSESFEATCEPFKFKPVIEEKAQKVVAPNHTVNFKIGESDDAQDNRKLASVVLGPCEDYTLDYFKGLKTSFEDQNRMFSSLDFVAKNDFENCGDGDFITDVDYSIDPWDKYMEIDNACGNESPMFTSNFQGNSFAPFEVNKSLSNNISDIPKLNMYSKNIVPENNIVSCLNEDCNTLEHFGEKHQDVEHTSGLITDNRNDNENCRSELTLQNGFTDKNNYIPSAVTSIIDGNDVETGNIVVLCSKDASPSDLSIEVHESCAAGEELSVAPVDRGLHEDLGWNCDVQRQLNSADSKLTLPSVNLIAATPVTSGRNSPEVPCVEQVWQTDLGSVTASDEGKHVASDGGSVFTNSSGEFVPTRHKVPLELGSSHSDDVCSPNTASENCCKYVSDAVEIDVVVDDGSEKQGDVKNVQTPDLQTSHNIKEQISSCPLSPRMGEKARLETCDSSGTEDSAFDFPRSDDVSSASSHCRDALFDRPEFWEGKGDAATVPGVKISVESFQGEYQINRCEVGAQLDEDGDEEFGLDIAKHSTPDDERSSDSGFRDKGSLSESCEDACDEKYHLEDIEAELEETFNRGGFAYVGRGEEDEEEEQCGHEECAASQSSREDLVCSVLLSDSNSTVQIVLSEQDDRSLQFCDSNEDSLEGTILATPGQNDEVDSSLILSFIASEQKHTELASSCVEDKSIGQEETQPNEASWDETYVVSTAGSGWYLHPPCDDTRQDGQTDDGDELPGHSSPKSSSSTGSKCDDGNNSDNSYVSFSLDEEFVTAIRNELREKLSCGLQHSESEGSEAEEEEDDEADEEDEDLVVDSDDDVPQEERTDITIHYNTYPASLSPILEEGESMSSLTTTLSDQFSPFLTNTVVHVDDVHEGPVFVLDLNKDAVGLSVEQFEAEIREALANCSLSSEDTDSSGAKAAGSGVLVEDLDPQADNSTVLVHDTAKPPEEDDLLLVDVETNKAVLLESPTPKSHLAFIQNKKILVVTNSSPSLTSSDSVENVSNQGTCVLGGDKFYCNNLLSIDINQSPKNEEIFTPDSISPDVGSISPDSTAEIITPNTDNLSDYFLTPDTSAVSREDTLGIMEPVDSRQIENEVSDKVEEIHTCIPNNEAAEIISELENRGFVSSKEKISWDVVDNTKPNIQNLPSSSDSEHVEMLSLESSWSSSEVASQKLSELDSSMLGTDSNDSSHPSPDGWPNEARDQSRDWSKPSPEAALQSTKAPMPSPEEVARDQGRDWSKPSPEAVLLSTKAPMPSPEEVARDQSRDWSKPSPEAVLLSTKAPMPSPEEVARDQSRDRSKPSPEAVLLSTKAPMPSPEEVARDQSRDWSKPSPEAVLLSTKAPMTSPEEVARDQSRDWSKPSPEAVLLSTKAPMPSPEEVARDQSRDWSKPSPEAVLLSTKAPMPSPEEMARDQSRDWSKPSPEAVLLSTKAPMPSPEEMARDQSRDWSKTSPEAVLLSTKAPMPSPEEVARDQSRDWSISSPEAVLLSTKAPMPSPEEVARDQSRDWSKPSPEAVLLSTKAPMPSPEEMARDQSRDWSKPSPEAVLLSTKAPMPSPEEVARDQSRDWSKPSPEAVLLSTKAPMPSPEEMARDQSRDWSKPSPEAVLLSTKAPMPSPEEMARDQSRDWSKPSPEAVLLSTKAPMPSPEEMARDQSRDWSKTSPEAVLLSTKAPMPSPEEVARDQGRDWSKPSPEAVLLSTKAPMPSPEEVARDQSRDWSKPSPEAVLLSTKAPMPLPEEVARDQSRDWSKTSPEAVLLSTKAPMPSPEEVARDQSRDWSKPSPEAVLLSTKAPMPSPEEVARDQSRDWSKTSPEAVLLSTKAPMPSPEEVVRDQSRDWSKPSPEAVLLSTKAPMPSPEEVARDQSRDWSKPSPEAVLLSTKAPMPSPEEVARNQSRDWSKPSPEAVLLSTKAPMPSPEEMARDQSRDWSKPSPEAVLLSTKAPMPSPEEMARDQSRDWSKPSPEAVLLSTKAPMPSPEEMARDQSRDWSKPSPEAVLLSTKAPMPSPEEMARDQSRDWSKPSPEAVLLSTKAPMPSPEEMARDQSRDWSKPSPEAVLLSTKAPMPSPEEMARDQSRDWSKPSPEAVLLSTKAPMPSPEEMARDQSRDWSKPSPEAVLLSTKAPMPSPEEMARDQSRDWSKPSPEAVLLSTKAPMPSPEEEAWKKIPSVLALSELSDMMTRCGPEESPSHPYCRDDDDLMSTSFSTRDDCYTPDCYTPDWESESEDTNEEDNSSSSGEFIWKVYEGAGEFPMEAIAEEEEDADDADDADESCSSGSGTEFVPSAWDSRAAPGRSALRSPDKKSEHKKSVSFKRQKYHCVYEYPREISDSETETQDCQHWNRFTPQFDYSSYADWELDADVAEMVQEAESDPDAADCRVPQQFDFYKLSSVDYELGPGAEGATEGEETGEGRPALGELRHTRDRLTLDLGAAGKRAGLEPVQGEASLLDSGIESGSGTHSARTLQAALESAS